MKPAIERIDVRRKELNQLLERARELLSEEDYRKLKAPVDTLEYLTELVADKDTTIRHLRQLLLPPARRRPRRCSPRAAWSRLRRTARKQLRVKGRRKPARGRGMGRNGVDDFTGARQVEVLHQKLKHGDRCPECGKGNVYGQKEPKVLVRIVGQAPLAATVYSLERLRCGACGQVFTTEEPEGGGPEK